MIAEHIPTDFRTSVAVSVDVNGSEVRCDVAPRLTLADFLRDKLRLTGTHVGCEQGVCGSCTVLVEDRSVRACLTLAVQVDGLRVTTVEGLSIDGEPNDLQQAFCDYDAIQCGFCTPGLLMTCTEMLNQEDLSEHHIREYLSGNLCRCTGYSGAVAAVRHVHESSARRHRVADQRRSERAF